MMRGGVILLAACGAGLWCVQAPAQILYQVRPGDTLTYVAQRNGTTVAALARLNRLDPADVLFAGRTIRIPGASRGATERYVVRGGDTLTSIAARYGTNVANLARLNGFDPRETLLIGVSLRVPRTDPVPRRASLPAGWSRYRVRRGDTLTAISILHRTTIAAIARANLLDPNGILLAGAVIVVPPRPPVKRRLPTTPSRDYVRDAIERWATYYGVRRDLALALAWMESGFQANVVSPSGAWGVMQIIPDTWAFTEQLLIGSPIARTADGNIRVGLAYFRHLLGVFGGDERLALAAYFQGPRSVQESGMLTVTRLYVADVLALAGRM
jgi:soluble lytic murein transglycosylase-like protein